MTDRVKPLKIISEALEGITKGNEDEFIASLGLDMKTLNSITGNINAIGEVMTKANCHDSDICTHHRNIANEFTTSLAFLAGYRYGKKS